MDYLERSYHPPFGVDEKKWDGSLGAPRPEEKPAEPSNPSTSDVKSDS